MLRLKLNCAAIEDKYYILFISDQCRNRTKKMISRNFENDMYQTIDL